MYTHVTPILEYNGTCDLCHSQPTLRVYVPLVGLDNYVMCCQVVDPPLLESLQDL